ncbi:hypothetical protein HCA61_17050 [Rhodococcus sp. HNM0563]|nr:hypothetical protein [Rhodococcus sp. HNM0563]
MSELLKNKVAIVTGSAVVGREVGAAGQEPVAFVVPAAGVSVEEEDLMAYVAERVLPYKKIRQVVILDALPTSAAGKILKTDLRAQL